MKTFYIIRKDGYRVPVYGRVIYLFDGLFLFYRVENDQYVIRCQRTGLCLGVGQTLTEAKERVFAAVAAAGLDGMQKRINKEIKRQGPKGGK